MMLLKNLCRLCAAATRAQVLGEYQIYATHCERCWQVADLAITAKEIR